MAAERTPELVAETAPGSDLMVRLDTQLRPLTVGRGTAIFCFGACFHRRERVEGLELLLDGKRHRAAAARMPRLDLFQMLHPGLDLSRNGATATDPASLLDPELRSYRSGFWATIPVAARERPGTVELEVAARLASGAELVAPLGTLQVVERTAPPSYEDLADHAGQELIAVCMTTFDPDMTLFRTQIDSLRAQTDEAWICLISDDCSREPVFEAIKEAVAGDARFVLTRSPRNVGYYRNFERALELVPPEAKLVALCDQDDRWHPEKLRTLRGALGRAQLVYSDQRLIDTDGRVLSDTLWRGRRNNHTNLASLLIANSITGAAMLLRREVAELALPFPDPPGWQFHDHWLALVAMATGDVAYVDRALYDYVQHGGASVGQIVASAPGSQSRAGSLRKRLPSVDRLRASLRGWRSAYFYGYYLHEVQAQALLSRCSELIPVPKRRALKRFIAAARAPLAFAWLAARPLRRLVGANETLGTESEFARGIIWRHLIEARTGRKDTPFGAPHDATCPPLTAEALGQGRLARWRGGI